MQTRSSLSAALAQQKRSESSSEARRDWLATAAIPSSSLGLSSELDGLGVQPQNPHSIQSDTGAAASDHFFKKLAVSKDPLRWTPAGLNQTTSPSSPTAQHAQAQHPTVINYRRPSRSVSAITLPSPSWTAPLVNQTHGLNNPPPTAPPQQHIPNTPTNGNWAHPQSPSLHHIGSTGNLHMSRSYTSINNYQPSSSWIANGWGAVVAGTAAEDPGAGLLGTSLATNQQDSEWPISNTPYDRTEWRKPPTQMHSLEWAANVPQNDGFASDHWQHGGIDTLTPAMNQLHISDAPSPQLYAPPVPPPNEEPFEMVGEGRWRVIGLIGAGSFGEVFAAVDTKSGVDVAIKRELSGSRKQQLPHEYAVYQLLRRVEGFPRIHFSGTTGPYNILVMDRLGPSLKTLQKESPTHRLPLRTLVQLAPQLLRRLQSVHEAGVLFRDVKPDQFCIGRHDTDMADRPTVYLIDFGLATAYRDATGKHIKNPKPLKNAPKTGTARYASLNVHKGKHHARRDDLESLGYTLVELATGSLPWTGIRAVTSADGWRKIGICKDDLPLAELCAGLPREFALLLEHARELRFADEPAYGMLVGAFVELLMRMDEETGGAPQRLKWTVEEEPGANGGYLDRTRRTEGLKR
ncbi:kinase-like domain-containing protein [Chytriomyces sp. MP71]|nr:kinase-like domain-containing protein [Chytriomyces sp. MP71]